MCAAPRGAGRSYIRDDHCIFIRIRYLQNHVAMNDVASQRFVPNCKPQHSASGQSASTVSAVLHRPGTSGIDGHVVIREPTAVLLQFVSHIGCRIQRTPTNEGRVILHIHGCRLLPCERLQQGNKAVRQTSACLLPGFLGRVGAVCCGSLNCTNQAATALRFRHRFGLSVALKAISTQRSAGQTRPEPFQPFCTSALLHLTNTCTR